jgi:hypothetical protein
MLYDPITPTFCHPERQRPRQHANYTSVQIESSSQKLQDGFELEASVNYRSVMTQNLIFCRELLWFHSEPQSE